MKTHIKKHWTIRFIKWYLDFEYWMLAFVGAIICLFIIFKTAIFINDEDRYSWTYSDVRIISEKKDKAFSVALFSSRDKSMKIQKAEENEILTRLEIDFGSFQQTTRNSLFWLTILNFVLCSILIVFQVIFLRRFFTNIVRFDNIFSVENLLLLKKSAILCIIYAITGSILDAFVDIQLTKHIQVKGYVFSTEFLFEDLFWGVFMYAIAEIFQYGLEIQQENELTI